MSELNSFPPASRWETITRYILDEGLNRGGTFDGSRFIFSILTVDGYYVEI